MEATTNKEITVLTTKIPMEKKFIVDNFDNFKSEDIVFNISLKDCDYNNPKSIFTYLANCEVSNPYLNFDELETQGLDFMFNYMIEYLSFDRIYSIPQFDRFILKMLVYHVSNQIDDEDNMDDGLLYNIFMTKCPHLLEEIDYFFYSFSKLFASLVCGGKDKEVLDKEIKEASDNKLQHAGTNILTLTQYGKFYKYLGFLEKDKMYMYDEFVKPVINGETAVFYILKNSHPFQAITLLQRYENDPKKFTDKFNELFNKKE